MRHHRSTNGVGEACEEPENVDRAANLHPGLHLGLAFLAAQQFRQLSLTPSDDIRHSTQDLATGRCSCCTPSRERRLRRVNRRLRIGLTALGVLSHFLTCVRGIGVHKCIARRCGHPLSINEILVLFHNLGARAVCPKRTSGASSTLGRAYLFSGGTPRNSRLIFFVRDFEKYGVKIVVIHPFSIPSP